MGNSASRHVFGQELSELWRREHDVPVIVARAVHFIEENGLDEPELFVAPVSKLIDGDVPKTAMKNPVLATRHRIVAQIRAKCNKGLSSTVEFVQYQDPHIAAGVLKLFFQDMKTPLLLDSLYESWIEAAAQDNELARVTAFRSLFRGLPDAHQVLLAFMLRFFLQLLSEQHSSRNRLTKETLASIFAPRFLRRRVAGLRADKAHTLSMDPFAESRVVVNLLEFFADVVEESNEDVVVNLQRENVALRQLAERQQAALQRLRSAREAEMRKMLIMLMRRSFRTNKLKHFHAWRRYVQQIRGRTAVYDRLQIALDALEQERAVRFAPRALRARHH